MTRPARGLAVPPRPAGVTVAQWIIALDMSEETLNGHILNLAGYLGYPGRYHTRDSRGSEKGYPDLTLVSPSRRRTLFIECKSETGELSGDQQDWRDWLIEAGEEWYCFRPTHWLTREVEEILSLPCRPIIVRRALE